MHITVVNDMAALSQLKSDWEAAYAADPEAQFFLSWTWMQPWIAGMRARWMVLVARPNSETDRPVAFLPLRFRASNEAGGKGRRELMMAGNCSADYTGVICDPAYQEQALPDFGRFLRKQEWDICAFQYVAMSRKRKQLFLSRFSRRDFALSEVTRALNRDGVNNHVCPRVDLPADWESYLAARLGGNTRQKVRRFLRKVDAGEEFRIVPADAESLERSIDILLELWAEKWAKRKGPQAERILTNMRGLLRSAFGQGCLFMPVLWRGAEPLGALGLLVDPVRRSLLFYVGGCRTDINNPAPGTVLHAYSIRHAIAQGMRTYDFLRGDEPYKFAFGAENLQLTSITIKARQARTTAPAAARSARMPDWYQPPAQVLAQGGNALMTGKVRVGANGLPAILAQR